VSVEADLLNAKHFEDFHLGEETTVGNYLVTTDEIIEFARKWDPQPFHIDEEAAKQSIFGGLIACGCHLVSISILLENESLTKPHIIAGLGWDHLRFPNPVRPGDKLFLTVVCLEKRDLKSRAEQGIVRNLVTLTNQKGEPVLTYQDTIIVAKRAQVP
jgi:acyl dehydratase